MARKFFFATALMIAVVMTTTTKAQECDGPVRVLSIYTTVDRQASFSIGSEFGSMRDESPWGYYGGMLFTIKKPQAQEKERTQAQGSVFPSDITIYMKGSFRLFRSEWTSIHVSSSVEMNTRSQVDIKPGVRLLFPVSDRVALSAEPVYSPRNKDVTGRVGFTIAF